MVAVAAAAAAVVVMATWVVIKQEKMSGKEQVTAVEVSLGCGGTKVQRVQTGSACASIDFKPCCHSTAAAVPR